MSLTRHTIRTYLVLNALVFFGVVMLAGHLWQDACERTFLDLRKFLTFW